MSEKPSYEELEQRVRELERAGSELQKAEKASREKMLHQKILMDTSLDGIAIIDQRHRVREANRRFAEMLGYTNEEVLGLHTWDWEDIMSEAEIRCNFADLSKTNATFETRHRRKDGTVYDAEVTACGTKLGDESMVLTITRDITDRKLAEKALRETESRYRAFFKKGPDGVVVLDADTLQPIEFNDQVCRQLGYARDEFAQLRLSDIEAKETVAETVAHLRKVVREGYDDFETLHRAKNGKIRNVHVTAQLIGLGDRNVCHCIWRDITDRKRAQEALSAYHRILQSLLDAIPDLLIVVDREFRIKFTNAKGHDLITQPDSEKQGTCYGRFKLLDEPCEDCSAMPVFDTGCIVEREMINPADGRAREVRAFPIFNSEGKVELVCEHVRDITERKLAEAALRESEEKYRLLVENATDAIFIAQDGVIKFANPRAEYMTGYSAAQLAKLPFIDLVHPEDKDMVLERHLKRLNRQDPPNIYGFKIVNKTGEVLSVELSAVLIEWEGKPATLNFLRDITAQKELELQLQQAQKMEALGTLAGGIAHDFNNLLMAIQGRTSIMLMDKDSSHSDLEHLKGIEGHIESASDLTKQLLGFARGGKYEVKPTDLNALIEKENNMFGRTKKEITIHGKYAEGLWPVEIDRGQIEQVLLNLYVNAWQAMPGGGDLYVETENITLDENFVKPFSAKPGKYVKISVTDTGTGMDNEIREKIFDPFFTTKKLGRGTGLGLASAYGIVKNHAGIINVHSTRRHGSTFNIYLPASYRELVEETKTDSDVLKGSETVLLVDDEDMISEVAEELLRRLGYSVMKAGSGREAIEIYEKNRDLIDVVILDMIMPDMSGGDTYDRMKEIDPDVKVLLSSGYSINGHAKKILDLGCNGFIQKPYNMKQLSHKLREILDQN
jgi:two-component system cell cycle sensor histidine kinase/response regulator CckA